jgi:hypothetical protein
MDREGKLRPAVESTLLYNGSLARRLDYNEVPRTPDALFGVAKKTRYDGLKFTALD